jgi:hypothetical protein
MQTKKWGPPGWDFLQSVAFKYPLTPTYIEQQDYCAFFHCLGKQLPCKYCRESWCLFELELPIEPYISTNRLPIWIYLMHNKVNNKLRMQGNSVPPDPTFEDVSDKYYSKRDICTQNFWDFLHVITFNYQLEPTDEQKYDIKKFFQTLCSVFPCNVCRRIFKKIWDEIHIDSFLESRYKLIYWLYLVHQKVNSTLIQLGYSNIQELSEFESFCEKYEDMRAQCNSSKKSCSVPLKK